MSDGAQTMLSLMAPMVVSLAIVAGWNHIRRLIP